MFLVGALFTALNVGTGGRFGPADLGADPPPIWLWNTDPALVLEMPLVVELPPPAAEPLEACCANA